MPHNPLETVNAAYSQTTVSRSLLIEAGVALPWISAEMHARRAELVLYEMSAAVLVCSRGASF